MGSQRVRHDVHLGNPAVLQKELLQMTCEGSYKCTTRIPTKKASGELVLWGFDRCNMGRSGDGEKEIFLEVQLSVRRFLPKQTLK